MLNQDGSVQLRQQQSADPYLFATDDRGIRAGVHRLDLRAGRRASRWQWNAYITSNGPMVPYAPEHDSGSKQLLNGYCLARRRHAAAGSEQRARQHIQSSQRRAFRRQAVDPAPGEEQSQSRIYLACGGGLQQQRPGRARRHAGHHLGGAAGSRSQGQRQRRQRPGFRWSFAGAGAVHRRDGARLRRPDERPELLPVGPGQPGAGPLRRAQRIQLLFARLTPFRAPRCWVGEFEIHTPNNAIWRANVVRSLFSQWSNPVENYGPGTTVDLTAVRSAGGDAGHAGQRAGSYADPRNHAGRR